MDNIDGKLAKLSPDRYAEPSRSIIKGWKDRVPKLIALQDWVGHPTTQEWLKMKQEAVQSIVQRLGSDDSLSEAERQRLFGEKRAHQFDISQMTRDPQGELEVISRSIEEENSSAG